MKRWKIVLSLLTVLRIADVDAGNLHIGGNLEVASNLTANAVHAGQLTITTMSVDTVTLGGETRTNWPSIPSVGGRVNLGVAVLDFAQPGQFFLYTLKGDTKWVFTNHVAGRQICLEVAQDSTGGWQNIWPANLLWPVGTSHNGSASNNCFSVFKVLDTGTDWLAQPEGLNYQLPCATNCQFALQFDGRNNYVSLDNLFVSIPTAITIEMWIKGDAPTSGGSYLYSASTLTNLADYLLIDESGRLSGCVVTDAGANPQTLSANIMDGIWHHVALVWDGLQQRLFVDGLKNDPKRLPGTLKIGNSYLGGQAGDKPFKGSIDEVRISKIARYSDSFSPDCTWIPDVNTIALWHLNEGWGIKVADASGNDRSGLLQGSPVPMWVDGVICAKH